MKASLLFKEYVWIVDTIRRAGHITLRQLNERWLGTTLSDGIPFSRTTFRRHRQEVEEMFGILIGCDNANRYFIDDSHLLSTDSVEQWMLGTLSVSNIVSEARDLHDRILLETIPSQSDHLSPVVEAMRSGRRVVLTYHRYGSATPRQWTVEPYCLKLFRRRWYLLARFVDGGFAVFSFDRILALLLTDETFTIDPLFDAQSYFAKHFGVMVDDRTEPRHIVLRAFGKERFAMRDLPIHPSQQLLADEADYTDFDVCLHPTSDFLAHILSRGRWLKVISPSDIAQEIKRMHLQAATEYE